MSKSKVMNPKCLSNKLAVIDQQHKEASWGIIIYLCSRFRVIIDARWFGSVRTLALDGIFKGKIAENH